MNTLIPWTTHPMNAQQVIGLEIWVVLDPSQVPLIALLSSTGSVLSQTKPTCDRVGL